MAHIEQLDFEGLMKNSGNPAENSSPFWEAGYET
jgi:hypothetical protein